MSFPPYPEYKDSGVEWLGKVPAHWGMSRLKYFGDLITGITPPSEDLTNYAEAGWPWIRPDDLDDQGKPVQASRFLTEQGWEYCRPVGAGSTLVCCIGSIGKLGYTQELACTNQQVTAIQPFYDARYLFYLVYASKPELDLRATGNVLRILNAERLGNVPAVMPPADESAHIATFLDHETARIDALMEEQQRLIKLLKEKRQAVISHAVTKGLDPDVPMKDSGVEWLGEVPEHWDVVPTGYRYEIQLGRMLNETRSSGENLRPYLRVFDVQWGVINTQDLPLMDFPPSAQKAYRLEQGDLMVNEGGSYVGRSAIWHGELRECYYQKALHRLRPRWHELDTADYFLYVMEMAMQKGVFVANANQTTIDHLTAEQFRRHRFAFPPLVEQQEIARYLEQSIIKLERLTEEAQGLITLLQERRSALISAAVTGKIDVRGWQPPAGSSALSEAAQTEAV